MGSKKGNLPISIDLLGDTPGDLGPYLRSRGVATCEQAYEQVVRLLHQDPGRPLPGAITREDLVQLRERLEAILPEDERAKLSDSGRVRWTDLRPPGVLPIDDSKEPPDRGGGGDNLVNCGHTNDSEDVDE